MRAGVTAFHRKPPSKCMPNIWKWGTFTSGQSLPAWGRECGHGKGAFVCLRHLHPFPSPGHTRKPGSGEKERQTHGAKPWSPSRQAKLLCLAFSRIFCPLFTPKLLLPGHPPWSLAALFLQGKEKRRWVGEEKRKKEGREPSLPFKGKLGLGPLPCPLDIVSGCPSESSGGARNTLGLTWGKNKRRPEGKCFGKLQVAENRGLTQASFFNLDCNKNR